MDSQTDAACESLARQKDASTEGQSLDSGTVNLAIPPGFTLATLYSASGLGVEGQPVTLQSAPGENLSVGQNTVSLSELMNTVPITTSLTSNAVNAPLQWGTLGGQGAVITFHTVPFLEGGQEIAIPDSCLPAGVDLNTTDHATLVQSLVAQGIPVKTDYNVDKSGPVDTTQLEQPLVSSGYQGQDFPVPPSHLAPTLTDIEAGPSSIRGVAMPQLPTTPATSMELTDYTPIFTRVCATLNPDIINCVPQSRQALVDQLNKEDNVQIGIDEHQRFTLETSLGTLSRVHNCLKDLLNLPQSTKLQFSSQPMKVTQTQVEEMPKASDPEMLQPPQPGGLQQKSTEERGVTCHLLLPFVSSRGRHVKASSHLPAVINENDPFDSEDSNEPVKPVRPKRKGRPRKAARNSSVVHLKDFLGTVDTAQTVGLNVPGSEVDMGEASDAGKTKGAEENQEGSELPEAVSTENAVSNGENMLDASQRPGVLRKSKSLANASKATKMRRIYEERVKFKFFCDKCSFKSKRESHYKKHMKLHEGGGTEIHSCSECDFKTIRLSHLQRHKLLHKASLIKCNLCGYLTDTRPSLLKHMKLRHPAGKTQKESFHCEICGHTSHNRNYFTRHLLRHARDSLESNNATVAGPDGFQCLQCNKTFLRRVHFARHLRDVHGPQLRPYLCDICGKSFKRPDALQQHKVVHTSQANRTYQFHCNKCNKGFRSQAHLNEHATMHSTERPYLCHYCGSSFKTQSVQRKHVLSLHLQPGAHRCNLCIKKFNTPYGLRRHMHTHNARPQRTEPPKILPIDLDMDAEEEARLEHEEAQEAVVAVASQEGLDVGVRGQDVMETGIEELGQGDGEEVGLQAQYIVQGNETATALFYLTGSL